MIRRSERRTINYPMLLKVMGWLLMIESLFMLIPFIVAFIYKETDWIGFLISTVLTFGTGLTMTRRIHPKTSKMGRREGFLLTASIWIVFSLFGMLPFLICIPHFGITDSFFESMSGFTTTGASLHTSVERLSHAIHIWRALMQWIGGMGIILFTLAVVPMLNSSGGMQMFNAEVTGITHDKVRPRISQTAKFLWLTYIVLTILAIVCYWLGPMDAFDSICHGFGTLSTGGYTTHDAGISAFSSPYLLIVSTIFMFLGGINFGLIIRSLTQGPKVIWQNEVFRAFVVTIAAMTVVFIIVLIFHYGLRDPQLYTLNPLFMIVSVMTSTGYTVAGFPDWGFFTLGLIFIMMFVGGCAGSTSGGAKIDRILFLIKYCRNEVYRCIHPNVVLSVKQNGRVQPPGLVTKVISFLCLYVVLIIIGALGMTLFGVDPAHAFFSAFSCVSNTGLSASDVVYGNSYAAFPLAAKWILSALMLIGRLEIFTILIILTPTFWKR